MNLIDTRKRVHEELTCFTKKQSMNATSDARVLGSTEVIESVIGKLNNLDHDQVKRGFTSMPLRLLALVSKTTQNVIQMLS